MSEEQTRPRTLVLIDGHSLAYRAHYAFIRNPLRNSQGRNTQAVFGFVNTLRRVLETLKPDHAAVVFDAPGKTFRHIQFQDYKALRPRMPEELVEQLPAIKEVVRAFGITQFEEPGFEADDVLGSLAVQLNRPGTQIWVVTSDKDLLQLVGERVTVYDPFKDIHYDRNMVHERYGVYPEQVADFLALSGDASDNIPGVPGIGPKRAQAIVQAFGSLESALDRDARLSPYREQALISKSLATVRTDLDLGLSIEDMRIGAQDRTTLVRLFRELEFSSLLRELMEEDRPDIRLITEPTRVMRPAETTVGLGLDSQYCYVALSGEEVMRYGWDDPRLREQVLGNRSVLKTGHDLKILFKQLMRQGWDDSLWPSRSQMNALRITPDAETNALRLTPDALRQKVGFGVGREASGVMGFADCKIAAWLVDPNRKRYELADLALQYLQKVASGIDGTRAAVLAFRLWKVLSGELARLELLPLFGSVEMPLVPVLAEMETRGVMLNLDFLASLTQELQAELTGLEERIQIAAGRRFNPRSPAQLSQVLFEHLKLTPRRRTKTGFSTDARVMEELAGQSPLASDILKLRELDKLLSTYLLPLMRLADSGGRIHTTLNQTGTATGRLSASEPNLQNIPIRSELGRRIREGVVAQPGFLLISADYSQIELRVLAEVTGDENLRSAFLQGADIHARTASAVLGCPESAVSAEARRIAKMVNYGIIYGMSDYGLAGRLGIAKDEARTFIERYLTLYPRVAQWCQTIPEETRARGWAQTKFGRIRPLPDLDSKVAAVREAAVRAAINTPIQGTAADIVKQAMIAVTAQLHQALFQGGLVLQVHDELLFEIEQDRVHEAQETIRATMESVWDGEIPMRVEIGVGHTWAAAHDNTHSAAKA